ncbi:hypothetical protein FACS1894187_10600 [Synergistales bacterium]|nr:hypothetical protein FACS1894187_10600 [Synergistales bacterium]
MKKDTFYRCMLRIYENKTKTFAVKTQGYSEGDIGLHKEKYSGELETWIATHIPTGAVLASAAHHCKTRTEALKQAQCKIAEHTNFQEKVEQFKRGEKFKAFQRSRYDQSVTGVF